MLRNSGIAGENPIISAPAGLGAAVDAGLSRDFRLRNSHRFTGFFCELAPDIPRLSRPAAVAFFLLNQLP